MTARAALQGFSELVARSGKPKHSRLLLKWGLAPARVPGNHPSMARSILVLEQSEEDLKYAVSRRYFKFTEDFVREAGKHLSMGVGPDSMATPALVKLARSPYWHLCVMYTDFSEVVVLVKFHEKPVLLVRGSIVDGRPAK